MSSAFCATRRPTHGGDRSPSVCSSAAPRFGLDTDEANALIDRTAEVIRGRWRSEVLARGGSARDCDLIAPAFLHAGFEYPVAR